MSTSRNLDSFSKDYSEKVANFSSGIEVDAVNEQINRHIRTHYSKRENIAAGRRIGVGKTAKVAPLVDTKGDRTEELRLDFLTKAKIEQIALKSASDAAFKKAREFHHNKDNKSLKTRITSLNYSVTKFNNDSGILVNSDGYLTKNQDATSLSTTSLDEINKALDRIEKENNQLISPLDKADKVLSGYHLSKDINLLAHHFLVALKNVQPNVINADNEKSFEVSLKLNELTSELLLFSERASYFQEKEFITSYAYLGDAVDLVTKNPTDKNLKALEVLLKMSKSRDIESFKAAKEVFERESGLKPDNGSEILAKLSKIDQDYAKEISALTLKHNQESDTSKDAQTKRSKELSDLKTKFEKDKSKILSNLQAKVVNQVADAKDDVLDQLSNLKVNDSLINTFKDDCVAGARSAVALERNILSKTLAPDVSLEVEQDEKRQGVGGILARVNKEDAENFANAIRKNSSNGQSYFVQPIRGLKYDDGSFTGKSKMIDEWTETTLFHNEKQFYAQLGNQNTTMDGDFDCVEMIIHTDDPELQNMDPNALYSWIQKTLRNAEREAAKENTGKSAEIVMAALPILELDTEHSWRGKNSSPLFSPGWGSSGIVTLPEKERFTCHFAGGVSLEIAEFIVIDGKIQVRVSEGDKARFSWVRNFTKDGSFMVLDSEMAEVFAQSLVMSVEARNNSKNIKKLSQEESGFYEKRQVLLSKLNTAVVGSSPDVKDYQDYLRKAEENLRYLPAKLLDIYKIYLLSQGKEINNLPTVTVSANNDHIEVSGSGAENFKSFLKEISPNCSVGEVKFNKEDLEASLGIYDRTGTEQTKRSNLEHLYNKNAAHSSSFNDRKNLADFCSLAAITFKKPSADGKIKEIFQNYENPVNALFASLKGKDSAEIKSSLLEFVQKNNFSEEQLKSVYYAISELSYDNAERKFGVNLHDFNGSRASKDARGEFSLILTNLKSAIESKVSKEVLNKPKEEKIIPTQQEKDKLADIKKELDKVQAHSKQKAYESYVEQAELTTLLAKEAYFRIIKPSPWADRNEDLIITIAAENTYFTTLHAVADPLAVALNVAMEKENSTVQEVINALQARVDALHTAAAAAALPALTAAKIKELNDAILKIAKSAAKIADPADGKYVTNIIKEAIANLTEVNNAVSVVHKAARQGADTAITEPEFDNKKLAAKKALENLAVNKAIAAAKAVIEVTKTAGKEETDVVTNYALREAKAINDFSTAHSVLANPRNQTRANAVKGIFSNAEKSYHTAYAGYKEALDFKGEKGKGLKIYLNALNAISVDGLVVFGKTIDEKIAKYNDKKNPLSEADKEKLRLEIYFYDNARAEIVSQTVNDDRIKDISTTIVAIESFANVAADMQTFAIKNALSYIKSHQEIYKNALKKIGDNVSLLSEVSAKGEAARAAFVDSIRNDSNLKEIEKKEIAIYSATLQLKGGNNTFANQKLSTDLHKRVLDLGVDATQLTNIVTIRAILDATTKNAQDLVEIAKKNAENANENKARIQSLSALLQADKNLFSVACTDAFAQALATHFAKEIPSNVLDHLMQGKPFVAGNHPIAGLNLNQDQHNAIAAVIGTANVGANAYETNKNRANLLQTAFAYGVSLTELANATVQKATADATLADANTNLDAVKTAANLQASSENMAACLPIATQNNVRNAKITQQLKLNSLSVQSSAQRLIDIPNSSQKPEYKALQVVVTNCKNNENALFAQENKGPTAAKLAITAAEKTGFKINDSARAVFERGFTDANPSVAAAQVQTNFTMANFITALATTYGNNPDTTATRNAFEDAIVTSIANPNNPLNPAALQMNAANNSIAASILQAFRQNNFPKDANGNAELLQAAVCSNNIRIALETFRNATNIAKPVPVALNVGNPLGTTLAQKIFPQTAAEQMDLRQYADFVASIYSAHLAGLGLNNFANPDLEDFTRSIVNNDGKVTPEALAFFNTGVAAANQNPNAITQNNINRAKQAGEKLATSLNLAYQASIAAEQVLANNTVHQAIKTEITGKVAAGEDQFQRALEVGANEERLRFEINKKAAKAIIDKASAVAVLHANREIRRNNASIVAAVLNPSNSKLFDAISNAVLVGFDNSGYTAIGNNAIPAPHNPITTRDKIAHAIAKAFEETDGDYANLVDGDSRTNRHQKREDIITIVNTWLNTKIGTPPNTDNIALTAFQEQLRTNPQAVFKQLSEHVIEQTLHHQNFLNRYGVGVDRNRVNAAASNTAKEITALNTFQGRLDYINPELQAEDLDEKRIVEALEMRGWAMLSQDKLQLKLTTKHSALSGELKAKVLKAVGVDNIDEIYNNADIPTRIELVNAYTSFLEQEAEQDIGKEIAKQAKSDIESLEKGQKAKQDAVDIKEVVFDETTISNAAEVIKTKVEDGSYKKTPLGKTLSTDNHKLFTLALLVIQGESISTDDKKKLAKLEPFINRLTKEVVDANNKGLDGFCFLKAKANNLVLQAETDSKHKENYLLEAALYNEAAEAYLLQKTAISVWQKSYDDFVKKSQDCVTKYGVLFDTYSELLKAEQDLIDRKTEIVNAGGAAAAAAAAAGSKDNPVSARIRSAQEQEAASQTRLAAIRAKYNKADDDVREANIARTNAKTAKDTAEGKLPYISNSDNKAKSDKILGFSLAHQDKDANALLKTKADKEIRDIYDKMFANEARIGNAKHALGANGNIATDIPNSAGCGVAGDAQMDNLCAKFNAMKAAAAAAAGGAAAAAAAAGVAPDFDIELFASEPNKFLANLGNFGVTAPAAPAAPAVAAAPAAPPAAATAGVKAVKGTIDGVLPNKTGINGEYLKEAEKSATAGASFKKLVVSQNQTPSSATSARSAILAITAKAIANGSDPNSTGNTPS